MQYKSIDCIISKDYTQLVVAVLVFSGLKNSFFRFRNHCDKFRRLGNAIRNARIAEGAIQQS